MTLAAWAVAVAMVGPPPAGPQRAAESGAPEATPEGDTEEQWRARRLTRTGIGLTAVGTLLGLGALFLVVLDPCDPEPGNDCRKTARRNAALSVGVPAAALVASGVTLITVGQVKQRRLTAGLAAGRNRLSFSFGVQF